jgi:hypothetical protein
LPVLRAATGVVWKEPQRSVVRVDLEGTVPWQGRDVRLTLAILGGKVRDVAVDDVRLVPVQDYEVIPAPPPGDLVVPDLWARPASGPRAGLELGGTADRQGTATASVRCLSEGSWVASAMAKPVDGAFSVTVFVPPVPPCQIGLTIAAVGGSGATVACWDGGAIAPGRCPIEPVPDPAGPPVVARDVVARWSSGGLSVDYLLRANVPQPAPGAFESAVVTTTLTCPGGKRPVRHTRPVTEDWLEPGVDRVLGSPMVVHAEARPCDLALDYARDDHYDRVEVPLFAGCVDAGGAVRPGPCG